MSAPMPFVGSVLETEARREDRDRDFADVPLSQYNNMLLIDQLRKSWSSIALGIILAGGFYPVVAGFAVLAVETLLEPAGPVDVIEIALTVLLFGVVGALSGMVWTNVWVLATLPIVMIVAWSLRVRGSIIRVGAFWGGLVGCIAVLPFLYLMIEGFNNNLLVGLVIGPALTTVIGQIGGAWGGRRAVRRIAWHESISRPRPDDSSCDLMDASSQSANEAATGDAAVRFQFQIRHLLWTAFWMSVLLSTMRLLGVPFGIVMPFLGGWLLYQAATLWIGGRLVCVFAR